MNSMISTKDGWRLTILSTNCDCSSVYRSY